MSGRELSGCFASGVTWSCASDSGRAGRGSFRGWPWAPCFREKLCGLCCSLGDPNTRGARSRALECRGSGHSQSHTGVATARPEGLGQPPLPVSRDRKPSAVCGLPSLAGPLRGAQGGGVLRAGLAPCPRSHPHCPWTPAQWPPCCCKTGRASEPWHLFAVPGVPSPRCPHGLLLHLRWAVLRCHVSVRSPCLSRKPSLPSPSRALSLS